MPTTKRPAAKTIASKTPKVATAKKSATKRAATKKTATKAPAAKSAAAKSVTVRMYNVGFGDAFLLFFPAPERTRKVLIDCGVHASGRNPNLKMSEAVAQIIAAATEADDVPRIDLVIATHRHQDHVEGFANQLWQTVEVREVWMPWTENYRDAEARRILELQSTRAENLQTALKLISRPQRFGLNAKQVGELKSLQEFAANNLVNAKAMATLHEGFKPFAGQNKVTRRYLEYKSPQKSTFMPEILPGVTVCVMGPSRDKEIIRDMEPEHGNRDEEWFRLTMNEAAGVAQREDLVPFDETWSATLQQYNRSHRIIDAATLKKVESAGEGAELGIAVALEKAVNGTSLMLMFQIGKAKLFFPGDAQLGTWKMAMNVPEWRELMKQADFYKVGHHGSHNATPPKFINEIAGKGFKAMIPVRPVEKWKFIPKIELMAAMRKKTTKIARADRPQDDPPGNVFTRGNNDAFVETQIPI